MLEAQSQSSMPTVNEIATWTGFSRASITTRVKRWGLGKNVDPKAVLDLRPLDQAHASKRSLEEQRALESFEATRLKRMQADKMEGRTCDVDEVLEAVNELHEGVAQLIKTSGLSEDRKEDIFSALRDHVRKWGERAGGR